MDLALHLKVVWRFKYLVLLGFLAACSLSVLAVAKVQLVNGKPHLSYRKAEIWGGSEKVLITQKGVPWGRLALPDASSAGSTTTSQQTSKSGQVFADPNRLASLAPFYAQLANSAAVQQSLPAGAVKVAPVVDTSTAYASVLPILQFTALGTTPASAEELAHRASKLFENYVTRAQNDASIPAGQRILLVSMNDTTPPMLVQPRKKSLAIVAFATVMFATLGLAFVLENLRPRTREGAVAEALAEDVLDARPERPVAFGQRTA